MHSQIANGDYEAARKSIESNKFLKRKRNRLLYCLETGKVMHFKKDYDSSNYYFNLADHLMEEYDNLMDVLVGNLINPATAPYRAEDIELVLINYYKSLNYLYLGKKEDALVEVRKINLKLHRLEDKNKRGKNRYRSDAFSQLLTAMIYESEKDCNNAFIAYRNAYESYSNDSLSIVYGCEMPERLKADLIQAAYRAGFVAEAQRYEQTFGIKVNKVKAKGGELVLFWENGLGPFKEEEALYFMLSENQGGFYFVNSSGVLNIPFVLPSGTKLEDKDKKKILNVEMFKMALPKYVQRPAYYQTCVVQTDSLPGVTMQEAENVDHIAMKTLQDRMLKETALALERAAVRAIQTIALKSKDDGAGDLLQLANLFIEKADTRNWQTLPSSIQYTRIPLKEGENQIKLIFKTQNNQSDTLVIQVKGTGNMIFKNVSTPRLLNQQQIHEFRPYTGNQVMFNNGLYFKD